MCLGISPNEIYYGIWTSVEVENKTAGTLTQMDIALAATYKLTKNIYDLNKIIDEEQFSKFLHKISYDIKN